ncbi:MAG: FtsW/RodA/SpoVE family cell cycle protein [Bacteroidaceae bacterium]|nr:FtsW/RodA/SpoVE family cell cycle protein [Bacteroidaceae bacterium]
MRLPNIRMNKEGFLQGDFTVWMILFTLCMISIVEVYSASSNMTYKSGQYWRPVVEHGSYIMLGLLVTWIVHKLPCTFFKVTSVFGLLFSFILLGIVLFTTRINGAARWIGIAGITIQPSEFAKITLVGTAALLLATFRDKETGGASAFAFKWVAGLTAITCLLIVGENFSTAGIIFIVLLMMTWYAQAPRKWLLGVIVPIVVMGGIVFSVLKFTPAETAHEISQKPMLHRFETWANRIKGGDKLADDPMEYDIHENIQVTHARIAIATCNIVGKGPGHSVERDFLPQAFSDFIYAIIIEECGIEGGLLVMSLYLLLLYRARRIAEQCKNRFPAYLVMGLALMLVVQAMVNMAVATGAMPVTGQPLPLVSKGGTSTFITCAYIGMILSVSHTARKAEENEVAETAPETVAP